MRWRKCGCIYCPNGQIEWQKQFAMLPTPLLLNDDILRIFLGFCDKDNVGRIGYVDVSPSNPSKILKVSKVPSLDIGRPGCFDDNGVVPVSVIRNKAGKIYLYYVGFQLGVKVPYFMFCGLAVSEDNGETFCRISQSPILDRIEDEVFARCGVNVVFNDDKYRMWYIGTCQEGWTRSGNKLKPLYVMRYTESVDGIHWNKNSIKCLDYKDTDEHGFGRPFVWKQDDMFKMYYSIRTYSRGYYIGYAESGNGIDWHRKDNLAGISLSDSGWDSENMSYPYLFTDKHTGKTFMFYNGNACGKTGFGYAELMT